MLPPGGQPLGQPATQGAAMGFYRAMSTAQDSLLQLGDHIAHHDDLGLGGTQDFMMAPVAPFGGVAPVSLDMMHSAMMMGGAPPAVLEVPEQP
jgi:hypothetical protein